jgi:hypothetical protein
MFGMTAGHRNRSSLAIALAIALALALTTVAGTADRPHYDVPPGYVRCRNAQAWNGFFKWASVKRTGCRTASDFMRAYARAAERGTMPRRLRGYHCEIRYWRDENGDVYASRHTCRRGGVAIRFYGMV